MNLVRRNDFWPSTSFFDDFLTRDLFNRSEAYEGSVPRVNVSETNDDFWVEMAAPGMKKSDFQVSLDNHVLTIRFEGNDSSDESNERTFTRREFNYGAFQRSFYLPNTVEQDKIKATYKNGILGLVIPKKEEAKKKPVRTIAIT